MIQLLAIQILKYSKKNIFKQELFWLIGNEKTAANAGYWFAHRATSPPICSSSK
jgi:hypothetical protein